MKKIKKKVNKRLVLKEKRPVEYLERHRRIFIWGMGLLLSVSVVITGVVIHLRNRRFQASFLFLNAKGIDGYREIIDNYGGPLRPVAMLRMGNILYNQGRIDEAERLFRRFLRKYKRYPLRPVAELGIACCYEERGNYKEELRLLKQMAYRYRLSFWSKLIKEKIIFIEKLT